MKGKLKVTASGGTNPGANLKPSEKRPPNGGRVFMPGTSGSPAHMMSGSKDKAPPSRTRSAEIKGYLSKVSREGRETEKAQYKDLDRAMKGTDAKATKQDLRAAKGMMGGGMVKGYKDGGCVMAGRGGSYKGQM